MWCCLHERVGLQNLGVNSDSLGSRVDFFRAFRASFFSANCSLFVGKRPSKSVHCCWLASKTGLQVARFIEHLECWNINNSGTIFALPSLGALRGGWVRHTLRTYRAAILPRRMQPQRGTCCGYVALPPPNPLVLNPFFFSAAVSSWGQATYNLGGLSRTRDWSTSERVQAYSL